MKRLTSDVLALHVHTSAVRVLLHSIVPTPFWRGAVRGPPGASQASSYAHTDVLREN